MCEPFVSGASLEKEQISFLDTVRKASLGIVAAHKDEVTKAAARAFISWDRKRSRPRIRKADRYACVCFKIIIARS